MTIACHLLLFGMQERENVDFKLPRNNSLQVAEFFSNRFFLKQEKSNLQIFDQYGVHLEDVPDTFDLDPCKLLFLFRKRIVMSILSDGIFKSWDFEGNPIHL
jgi:hypothetical protein